MVFGFPKISLQNESLLVILGNVDDHATSTTTAAPAVAAPVNPIPGGGETVPNDIPSGGGVPSPSASIG